MLLIFTHKITPRFTYTMKQVFTRILGIDVEFATKVEDFIKHNGPKITPDKEMNQIFLNSLPSNFNQLKIKDTVYIPIIFSGLILRKELGYERSTGAEITQAFNQHIADNNSQKKPNNISRALRENETVKNEKWLTISPSKSGNLFSLSNGWEKFWDEYFNTDNLFGLSDLKSEP